jgi:subtilisin family serine protease
MFRMSFPALSFNELEERLHFKALWGSGIRGQGVTVAVLDTGFSYDEKINPVVRYEKDFTGEGNPRGARYWHGTSVARIIHLMAPEAHVGNFKVLPEYGPPTRETVCQAVGFCIQEFPKYSIINLSLYFEPDGCSVIHPCDLCAMVNEAVQRGIVVVAAAGNLGPKPGTITCPGLAKEALTVVSTWTKREAQWWDNLPWFKKWWWKDFTGNFGKTFGTSFSAAWVSGGIALLKSAFPESHPHEIKESILRTAYRLPKAPETSGLLRCKEALDALLNPIRYELAKRALYFNAGNKEAQRNNSYFAHELGFVLSFIKYRIFAQANYAEAVRELTEISSWLIPKALPDYEKQIDQLLELCHLLLTTPGRGY